MASEEGEKKFSSQTSRVEGLSSEKDVMLCYSRKDLSFLHKIKNALAERGITAWYDTQDIDKGTYWTESIAVAIKNCKAFIFLMSKDSLKSTYCMEELQMARAFGKPVFPVATDGNLIPILPTWALIIIHIQWTFLSEDAWNQPEFNKLCSAISIGIDKELTGDPIEAEIEPIEPSTSTEKLVFSEFWSQCFNSDTVYAVDLCKKLIAYLSPQLSQHFGKDALHEAIDVMRAHLGLAVANDAGAAYRESFEVTQESVERVLDIKKDDVIVMKIGEYWSRLEAIKTALLSHLRGKGLALLGSNITSENVHYYIYLAKYRLQDSGVKVGPVVGDKPNTDTKSLAYAANVRCQATLALGCLTSKDESLRKLVINLIMANLDDGDRLVREASCRAIGRLRAVEGVSKLLIIWRNDFIHPVRLAARDVLLKMGEDSQEAREAMELTEKLQQEMNGYLE